MKHSARIHSLAITLALLLLSCAQRPLDPPAPEASSQAAATTAPSASNAAGAATAAAPPTVDYVITHTAGAEPTAELPLIVALHGLGDTPESFSRLFAPLPLPARVISLRAPLPYYRGHSWFPIRVNGSSVKADTNGVVAATDQIAKRLGVLAKQFPTRGKPIVTGFSQGGMLAFALYARYPETLSLAIPIAGTLNPARISAKAPEAAPRLIALHGEADDRIPFPPTKALVEQFKAAGYPAELHAFPGVAHSIPNEVRRRLYDAIGEVAAAN